MDGLWCINLKFCGTHIYCIMDDILMCISRPFIAYTEELIDSLNEVSN